RGAGHALCPALVARPWRLDALGASTWEAVALDRGRTGVRAREPWDEGLHRERAAPALRRLLVGRDPAPRYAVRSTRRLAPRRRHGSSVRLVLRHHRAAVARRIAATKLSTLGSYPHGATSSRDLRPYRSRNATSAASFAIASA